MQVVTVNSYTFFDGHFRLYLSFCKELRQENQPFQISFQKIINKMWEQYSEKFEGSGN